MRNLISILVLAATIGVVEAVAQRTATSYIVNGNVTTGVYSFDVFAKRTGATSILVGTSSFFFTYNNLALIAPSVSNVSSRFSGPANHSGDYDPITVQIIQNRIAVTVQFTGNNTGLGSALASPDSERFCTVNLSIVNPNDSSRVYWDEINSSLTDSRGLPITNTFLFFDNRILPVQLSSFTATVVNGSRVRLNWTTISEVNNYGFYVERRRNTDTSFTEIPNSFIPGHGTTNEPHHYTFTDQSPNAPTIWYRLRQVDLDGTPHYTEPIQASGILVSVEEKERAPIEFALKQNYPNPFNPSTEIKFSVETQGRTTLEVFNIIGQKVATLFDGVAEPGQYYKVRFGGGNLASGIYLYRLQSGKRSDLKKLLLLK